ncbi:MAG: high frequency lysogenization protein HflD [Porticoccaceae bacterium]|jgi:high frequency lysogenization protein|nr:high frequency lysogenization protein HflD [Porticoccaceae bacterium]MEA3300999.1 high frequency lysogenization protein HflD [Pseudomonadota bacterium]HLS98586.1 high frequency lysogenization protein HflD [Porticoccaceae bacterium]
MWFSPPSRDQAIALAGVFQACQLVESLATTGSCLPRDFETCIHSLFEQNPPSTLAVFGDIDALWTGLDTLNRVLGATRAEANAPLLRYVLGVFYLQRKLARNPAMLAKVGEGIDRARRQAEHFSRTHPNVIANLADLYLNTLSTFNFRIQVGGMPQHLRQPDIANRIRCLLFAAIRAATLWQQVGGRRHQLVFQRQRLLELARDLRRQS